MRPGMRHCSSLTWHTPAGILHMIFDFCIMKQAHETGYGMQRESSMRSVILLRCPGLLKMTVQR